MKPLFGELNSHTLTILRESSSKFIFLNEVLFRLSLEFFKLLWRISDWKCIYPKGPQSFKIVTISHSRILGKLSKAEFLQAYFCILKLCFSYRVLIASMCWIQSLHLYKYWWREISNGNLSEYSWKLWTWLAQMHLICSFTIYCLY